MYLKIEVYFSSGVYVYLQEQVGYCWSLVKSLVLYPAAALPLGVGLLLAYWFPHMWVRLTCWKCPLHRATCVIVKVRTCILNMHLHTCSFSCLV